MKHSMKNVRDTMIDKERERERERDRNVLHLKLTVKINR